MDPRGETLDEGLLKDARLLVVDDEPAVRKTVAKMLSLKGAQVVMAISGRDAIQCLNAEPFDLVILDLSMPEVNGLEVLQWLQQVGLDTVAIMLTAHGTKDSAIGAFRQGVFDFLEKPVSFDNLIPAVLRGLKKQREERNKRTAVGMLEQVMAQLKGESRVASSGGVLPAGMRLLQVGEFSLDPQRRLVMLNNQPVNLTTIEYTLLLYLMQRPDQVISCRELVRHTHGYDLDERDARPIVRMHVHRLRQKLEVDPDAPRHLRTARGAGYILVTDSQAVSGEDDES